MRLSNRKAHVNSLIHSFIDSLREFTKPTVYVLQKTTVNQRVMVGSGFHGVYIPEVRERHKTKKQKTKN